VITIGFHDVVDSPSSARPIAPGHSTVYTIDRRRFRTCLEEIRKATADTAVHWVRNEAELSALSRQPVLLTFDDGSVGMYDWAAPALEALGWRGHFFITTAWIGRPGFLDREQIVDLHRRGHVIGSHSLSHPERMSHLSWEELMGEWSASCATLAEIIGGPVPVASVPGGYCSRRVHRTAAACGVRLLFTSAPPISTSMEDGCLALGRFAVRSSTAPHLCGAIASGAMGPLCRETTLWLVKEAAKRLGGRFYLQARRLLLSSTANRSPNAARGRDH
jgi:hypothetical protein